MTIKLRMGWGVAALALAATASGPASAQLDQTINEATQATAAAANSQQRVDQLEEERVSIFLEYRKVLQEIETQRLFVEQQKIFLQSQQNELDDVRRQITEVEGVLRDLRPMQVRMIDALENFVNLDLPFRYHERRDRIDNLRETLNNHNVAPSEQYRVIVEAYQIENDYGRFPFHYEGGLWVNPEEGAPPNAPTVDFLHIGRVGFLYIRKDDSEVGLWDDEAATWRILPNSYARDVRQAIRIVRNVATPDVFFAPLPGATVNQ